MTENDNSPEPEGLGYTPIFDPASRIKKATGVLATLSPFGSTKTTLPYVYHVPEIALAVNVALATNRPLLLSGRPGSGKSTLARDVADALGWEYQEDTITSRTMAENLLWKFDALQRLSDASDPHSVVLEESEYVKPGVLWWMFDPVNAFESNGRKSKDKAPNGLKEIEGVVVLLDELDKAEPDVPNDLLVPLSDRKFVPRGHTCPVESRNDYLLCITTNGERELPQAFVRRCVTLSLTRPSSTKLREIAVGRNKGLATDAEFLDDVLAAFEALEKEMLRENRRPPSTAEFLDAVQACLTLEPADRKMLSEFTMRKSVEVRDPEP